MNLNNYNEHFIIIVCKLFFNCMRLTTTMVFSSTSALESTDQRLVSTSVDFSATHENTSYFRHVYMFSAF